MVFSFIVLKGSAQAFQPKKVKAFRVVKDTLVLDSLSLVPGSVSFKTFPTLDSASQPRVNYKFHALIFHKKRPDSIFVSYKRFPYNFEARYFHKDPDNLYRDLSRPNNPFTINYNKKGGQENLFQNDGLTKNGNISRGISFGNSQDVVVNSNLNLQVSGKLTPEIDMVLAATDNNIPFQADGTTAQLQEFDKVFIQLNNATTKMVVGDFQLSRPQNSYFMSFYKRAQGAYLENTYKDTTSKIPLTFKTQISGAVSRGKFARQVFYGTESNQGPYRLQGDDNEPFIIILSGTEKIYIDGKLLQRGQENDYIIDYNTAELTFTARQLITKDKRIVAEFQYAERNYARSLFFMSEEVQAKKAKIYLNLYSEQDNKNRPLQQTLTQDQKNLLIGVGDSLDKAVYTGATRTDFNSTGIFYRKTDTLVNNIIYQGVYVYSTDPDTARYTCEFSTVGAGKGNYNQINSAANGKVYTWVAPVNGQLQGSYEPLIPLVAPKKSQMLTAGVTYSFTRNNTLNVEGVYTNNDINEFSTIDKGNDQGEGLKITSKNQTMIRPDSTKRPSKLVYNFDYEYVQKNFQQIERFRSIEFDRDWNRPLTGLILNDQHLASAEVGLTKPNGIGLNYSLNLFDEGKDYLGIRNNVSLGYKRRGLTTSYTGSYLTTNDQLNVQNTRFYRHKTLVSQRVEKLKFSYSDVFEHNIFRNTQSDSLQPKAYQFWEWEASVSNADSSKTNVKLFYKERRDKLNYGDLLRDSTKARNIGVQASVLTIKNNPINLVINYRKLELVNVVGTSLAPDNTLLSRLEYNPRWFKGLVTSSIFYETGYGLQNKQEYYYLQVAPGQGQYAWVDYNGDKIPQLNEFEISQFSDQAQWIRIYTPTNEYVKVLQNQLSVSVNIRPYSILKNAHTAGAKFVNRWILQTAVRLDNKMSDNKGFDNFNPLATVNDSLLIARNNNTRQSVFFNQNSPIFGADYTFLDNRSKQLLTSSIEEKDLLSHEIKWRANLLKAWALNSDNVTSLKQNSSQLFPTRDYVIKDYESEQKFTYQPNTVFRISLSYKYGDKRNIAKGTEVIPAGFQKARLNTFGFEMKYNQSERGSLTGKIDLIKITYNDDQTTPVAYEMLNGLNTGNNFTWELTYQRNLKNNIQISINYNGRKTPAQVL